MLYTLVGFEIHQIDRPIFTLSKIKLCLSTHVLCADALLKTKFKEN